MPKNISAWNFPDDSKIKASLVELSPGEELFLSYTEDLTEGPAIHRTGYDCPYMELVQKIGMITTDPDEQRWCTWYIDAEAKKDTLKKWGSATNRTKHWTNIDWQSAVRTWPIHLKQFLRYYPQYRVVAQQGAADLTMNDGCVAFVVSKQSGDVPVLLLLPSEPLAHRHYSCLVKRRDGSISIKDNVKFGQFPYPEVEIDGVDSTNDVELAIASRQIISDGKVVDFSEVVDDFGDLRHLVKLPNLNPEKDKNGPVELDLIGSPPKIRDCYTYYPRIFFGEPKHYDIWLGEAQLLADRNLRRAALKMPIHLNMHYEGLGAPRDVIRSVMTREGYTEESRVRERGDWRFLHKDATKPGDWLEIYLKQNGYPCSMVGVDEHAETVYLLAYNGGYGEPPAKSIAEVAEDFIQFTKSHGKPVHRALIFDEGGDVFQKVDFGNGLEFRVPTTRKQVRCCFIVGTQADGSHGC